MADLRAAAEAGRRATLDPGAFVKRGPDDDGRPYGERLDRWQARAMDAAIDALAAETDAKRVYMDELPWAPSFGRRCRARLSASDSTYGHFGRCELRPHSREQDHALERGLETLTWRSVDSITLTDYSPAHMARYRAEKAP